MLDTPTRVEQIASEAVGLARAGRLVEAEEKYQWALAAPSSSERFLESMGEYSLVLRRLPAAEAWYRQAIAAQPDSSSAHLGLGTVLQLRAEPAEAALVLQRAAKLDPTDATVYKAMSGALAAQGQHDEAERALLRGIATDPADSALLFALAGIYQRQGRDALAGRLLELGGAMKDSFYWDVTSQNYLRMDQILDRRGLRLVAVQYPRRSAALLARILEGSEDILIVDNEAVFEQALGTRRYSDLFVDACYGDFGHASPAGNRLLAESVGRAILEEWYQ